MTTRIVRLGTSRLHGEGLRIGTVRHPPRGVPKGRHASGNWYDVRFPIPAPAAAGARREAARNCRTAARAVNPGRWIGVGRYARETTSAWQSPSPSITMCMCMFELRET